MVEKSQTFNKEWVRTGERIFITGDTGLVGKGIVAMALGHDHLFGFNRDETPSVYPNGECYQHFSGDVLDKNSLYRALKEANPSIVLHTAALANVDYCQEHPDKALALNMRAAVNIAEVCNALQKPALLVSTDYVFSAFGGPFGVDHKPGLLGYYDTTNINIYGRTKWLGEMAFLKIIGNNGGIARIVSPYDETNLVKPGVPPVILEKIKKSESIRAVYDARTTYTHVKDIALGFNKIIKERLWEQQHIFHIAGPEQLSAYEVACILLLHFNESNSEIIPVSVEDYFKGKAPRPIEAGLKDSIIEGMTIEEALF